MHNITTQQLDFDKISEIIFKKEKITLSEEVKINIITCREYLDKKMASQKEPIYGINTGFGSLCDVVIPDSDLEKLQQNIVMSHACGIGDEVPPEIVKLMLLLKIQALSYGKSGVQLQTVERLVDFFNNDILPVVYQQGSLGASGDLAPLAHLSLPLLGKGEVYYEGKKQSAEEILKQLNLKPITLKSKEGLALLNGTQFMSAYGVWCLLQTKRISTSADVISAISLEAFDGRIEPFKAHIHSIRPHKGQMSTAANMRKLLEGSELIKRKKEHVQDPYSFRCIPQVHGASKDVIDYATNVFLIEINSVTDNPTVFPDEDEIISGGNFHGQPLALALDFLAIALAELGSISERRTYQLIAGLRGLPPFLVAKPGLNSGFMIPQYTAASIASQNKQLCSPASVDSIVSSNGQEDHVSMGSNAATKCFKVVENLYRILAIELMNASQALEFRRPAKSSPILEYVIAEYRKTVPFVDADKVMYPEIEKSVAFLKSSTSII
ncbi:MAG: histidine ammonia-lyase [Bacteroidetes bacterium RIFCSPLOWO2_12_FULL_35_15]|nr:MAG: histidine ammonia-lyase [Bacteroidetes bacterium RIFCSPLOWO2_12_FULL_35_15]